jgi:hypothetical protein
MATATKTYRFVVIDAPGYCKNRARVYSRHDTLSAARKALRNHWVEIPGSPRGLSACIVDMETSTDTDYIFWNGIMAAGYDVYDDED